MQVPSRPHRDGEPSHKGLHLRPPVPPRKARRVRRRPSMSGEDVYGTQVLALLAKARPRVPRPLVTLAQLLQGPDENPNPLQVDVRLHAEHGPLVQGPLEEDDK